ncbi:MAG: DUF721 domain-containing protein [Nitrospirota bacterium]
MAALAKAGEILAPWLRQSGVQHHLLEQRLQLDWAEIAGALVATHSRPLRLRQRQLTVAVESPAWLHQLRYLAPMLLEQIRRSVGPDVVAELRWVVGLPASSALSDSREQPEPARPLSAEAQRTIAAALEAVRDPELAERARRLLEKALR